MYGSIYEQIDQAMDNIRNGKVEQGLSQLQMLMSQASQDPDLLFELADIFYDLGHVDTALSLMQEAEPYFEDMSTDVQIEFRTLRAEMMIDLGKLDEAMDDLLTCVDLEPDHIRSAILLADIYLMQNMPEVACRYLENVLEQNPDEHDVRYILSEVYIENGEFEKARVHLEALRDSEYEDRMMLSQAKLFSRIGQFEKAYSLFQQCASQDPASVDALFGCAVTALQLGHLKEAISFAEQLHKVDRDHIGAFQVMGEALQKDGKLHEAKIVYQEALELDDQEEAIVLRLIELAYLLGETTEAEGFLDRLEELNDEHELLQEWRNRLTGMAPN